jgi:hypothetical protein
LGLAEKLAPLFLINWSRVMKTLTDIKQDMSELYEQLKAGQVDLKTAGELANISGKFLKAEQLELARDIFINNKKLVIENDA